MKNIFFIIFVFAFSVAKSQIVFEFDHDSASAFASGNPAVPNQLMIIKFEVSGEQYVNVNKTGKYISIYDMNHALVKKISLAGLPVNIWQGNSVGYVLYLSEHLFNLDSKKEFMYLTDPVQSNCKMGIYNEDGVLLFSDTASIPIVFTVPLQQYPIYNTSFGTKMILSYHNNHAKVFALGGTLTTAIAQSNLNLLNATSLVSNPFPNPTSSTTTIAYQLPPGSQQGEIVFYDLQGKEAKRFSVDNTFTSLLLSTSDLSAGTYYYQLQTANNSSGGKKLVVIK